MRKYLASRDGASSAEYAMLLGIIGGLVAIALFVFGGAMAEQMGSATNTLAQGGASVSSGTGTSSSGSGGGSSGGSSGTSPGQGGSHANGGQGWGGGSGGGRGH